MIRRLKEECKNFLDFKRCPLKQFRNKNKHIFIQRKSTADLQQNQTSSKIQALCDISSNNDSKILKPVSQNTIHKLKIPKFLEKKLEQNRKPNLKIQLKQGNCQLLLDKLNRYLENDSQLKENQSESQKEIANESQYSTAHGSNRQIISQQKSAFIKKFYQTALQQQQLPNNMNLFCCNAWKRSLKGQEEDVQHIFYKIIQIKDALSNSTKKNSRVCIQINKSAESNKGWHSRKSTEQFSGIKKLRPRLNSLSESTTKKYITDNSLLNHCQSLQKKNDLRLQELKRNAENIKVSSFLEYGRIRTEFPYDCKPIEIQEYSVKLEERYHLGESIFTCHWQDDLLAVGSTSGKVSIFSDSNSYELIQQSSAITCLRWQPLQVSPVLAVSNSEGNVSLWQAEKKRLLYNIVEEKGGIYTLDFDKYGEVLAFSGACSKIRLFDAIKGQEKGEYQNKEAMNRIYSLKFFEDNPNCFVTGGWDDILYFWDQRQSESTNLIFGPRICNPDGIQIKYNELLTSSWRDKDQLELFDLRTLKQLKLWNWQPITGNNKIYLNCCAFGSCGKKEFILGGTTDLSHEIRIYEKNVMNEWISRIDEVKSGINCVCMKENQQVFGVGTNSGEFSFYRIVGSKL